MGDVSELSKAALDLWRSLRRDRRGGGRVTGRDAWAGPATGPGRRAGGARLLCGPGVCPRGRGPPVEVVASAAALWRQERRPVVHAPPGPQGPGTGDAESRRGVREEPRPGPSCATGPPQSPRRPGRARTSGAACVRTGTNGSRKAWAPGRGRGAVGVADAAEASSGRRAGIRGRVVCGAVASGLLPGRGGRRAGRSGRRGPGVAGRRGWLRSRPRPPRVAPLRRRRLVGSRVVVLGPARPDGSTGPDVLWPQPRSVG